MSCIGEYIETLRQSKGYSQRKLGYLSGISNATINRIENGISNPDPSTLSKLSFTLGVSYEELLKLAGYLSTGKFIASNMRLIKEKCGMTYDELSKDIKKVTGKDITPQILKTLENGEAENITPAQVDIIAKYKGINEATEKPMFFSGDFSRI